MLRWLQNYLVIIYSIWYITYKFNLHYYITWAILEDNASIARQRHTEYENEYESETESESDPSLILHYEIVALALTPLPCVLSKLIDCVRSCA